MHMIHNFQIQKTAIMLAKYYFACCLQIDRLYARELSMIMICVFKIESLRF